MSSPLDDWHLEEEQPTVSFQSEAIEFELSQPTELTEWIMAVVEKEDCQLLHTSFIFCSDEYLLQLNQEYLGHDTYTDIITFPYTAPPLVEGDVFISIDRVNDNARRFGVSREQELHRVIIHGILHLCGYTDHSPEEKARMRSKEDEALKVLGLSEH